MHAPRNPREAPPTDYPSFAHVAQGHPRWPEIRWFCGELPYTAADRGHGVVVASDDLDLFDAALGADAGLGGPSYARPHTPEVDLAQRPARKEEKALVWALMIAIARKYWGERWRW